MARKKKGDTPVEDYRYEAKRKNIPPAAIAAEGTVTPRPRAEYSYSPRLPPQLQFDPTGKADALPELLAIATQRALSPEEARILADALRQHQPWLEWAGKRERPGFAVDPVALHEHERVSTKAIIAAAMRQDVQRSLFADPELEHRERVKFYQHDIAWANRLILGDSLLVMSSLLQYENMAGKVQTIYIDPPYGIKFASNFQPEVGKRDVKDKESDLTREPEMVRAYRDTWHLGVHSYLTYLRDRLRVARELLADSGSIFVQISDENLHRVRQLLDEVFGRDNSVSVITFFKSGSQTSELLPSTVDYILWYARDINYVKRRPVWYPKSEGRSADQVYRFLRLPTGETRTLTSDEREEKVDLPNGSKVYRLAGMTSQSGSETTTFSYELNGQSFSPGKGGWRTNIQGMNRLCAAEMVTPSGSTIACYKYINDFPLSPHSNLWIDTGTGSFTDPKVYVVQTGNKALARCLLMTTDPGDLVLDPTCGSGTTAYVAEQWGRRWITIDTSRVAVAIARQRLLTAKYDYYTLRDGERVESGFKYKTVPHITLKSIAQNHALDPIFARHEPVLEERLAACNAALVKVSDTVRAKLSQKLRDKERDEGKKAVTDADRRRWELPAPSLAVSRSGEVAKGKSKSGDSKSSERETASGGWEHWTVPFDTDELWPKELQLAVTAYRKAWRAKMDEVNACIAASAEQEELVDQPEVMKKVVRVSGPFTVEAVQPKEMSLAEPTFPGAPDSIGGTFAVTEVQWTDAAVNVAAYLEQMRRLLRSDGVRFPDNRAMTFTKLETASGGLIHARGRWLPTGESDPEPEGALNVAIAFGPQFGPVTVKQVTELMRSANKAGYDDLVIAAFSFDAEAQATLEDDGHPTVRVHLAHIRPDVNPGMDGLLKEGSGKEQIFTVFGQPRSVVRGSPGDEYVVEMEGVDIYDPVTNEVRPCRADKVAAWFLDGDYDGRTFCITQAFFPDRGAWDKLGKALGGSIDPAALEKFSGVESLPFKAGKHGKAAVKVIDPRGNEVMRVHELGTGRKRGD